MTERSTAKRGTTDRGTTERRNKGRYLCADLIRVDWLAGEDDFHTEHALLEDISEFGGCVQLERPIPLGVTMMLHIHGTTLVGHVCYCVYRDYGYFVGMRFSSDSPWDEAKVIPDHLTNLQALAGCAAAAR
jgi:hypothetical protein